mmetsp:Transcript_64704/g.152110  ORF Transcript_64704/g.152110 Transcript_64704/m.152110 type:complete len:81 (+) Transcript_64704:1110-1352(+)
MATFRCKELPDTVESSKSHAVNVLCVCFASLGPGVPSPSPSRRSAKLFLGTRWTGKLDRIDLNLHGMAFTNCLPVCGMQL